MDLTGTAILSVARLTRRYRRGAEIVTALDDVSLELYPGELTVAAGPSGSGKTTLLSILAGFERADAGTVTSHPPLRPDVAANRLTWHELAFVPQGIALLDELTVAENIEMPARLDRSADRAGAARLDGPADRLDGSADRQGAAAQTWSTEHLMTLLEIAHLAGRYPSMTSGGEQQRTAIARALRLRPAVLLGDEPTGHQDRERVDLVLGVLRQHAYAGHAVLISSHDEAVITAADRVITLADGRLVADTRPMSGRVPARP